jgi:hypothetical protein
MNWEAIGAVGETLGSVAVLVTLIYFSLQIRQNTKATRNTSSQYMLSAAQNTALAVASSNESVEIWLKGLSDLQSLNETEKMRARLLMSSQMVATDSLYWSYRQGTLDEELWHRQSNWMRTYLSSDIGKAVFTSQSTVGGYTESFVEYCKTTYPELLGDDT